MQLSTIEKYLNIIDAYRAKINELKRSIYNIYITTNIIGLLVKCEY